MAVETVEEASSQEVPWGTPQDHSNLRRGNAALLCWAVVWTAARLLLDRGVLTGAAFWLAVLGCATVAVTVVHRYLRFVRGGGEPLRLIQLSGLALGFGAVLVFSTTYRLLERAGAPDLGLADTLLVLVASSALGMSMSMMATIRSAGRRPLPPARRTETSLARRRSHHGR
jgi:hypothetical protein